MSGLVADLVFTALPQGAIHLPLAAINWHTFFFLLFAAVACCGAMAVVFADNVVRMALYLVMSLGAVAGLFFLAGAEFVGAMQLMIYVGGTLVLLVFGVMLTAQAPFVSIRSTVGDKVLAGVAGVAVLVLLLQATFSVAEWGRPASGRVPPPVATPIGMALLGLRVDAPADGAGPVPAGYLLPFEIVSVHLLVVLVGAAYLARAKRRRTPRVIDVLASQEPPASVAEHAAVGRATGTSSVLAGGRS